MERPIVDLQISSPLPSSTPPAALDVNPRVTNVEVETGPGGFSSLRIGLLAPDADRPIVYPALPEPVDADDMSHVVASIGGHVLFEGVPERIAAKRDGIECVGYGPAAGNWATLDSGTADRARTEVIAATALAAVPWFTVGEVPTPTNPSRRAWSETQHMAVSQIIETLCKEGADGSEWLFAVWENQVASVRSVGSLGEPVYRLPYDPATMDIWWDYSEVADAVRASYQDITGRPRVTDWVYRSGFDRTTGRPRERTLSASGPPATLMQFLATWMAEHGRPRLTGSIALDDWRGLTLASGLEVPGYVARYGEPIEIEGVGRTYISRTSCNLSTGQTRIELATPPVSTFAGMVARVQDTTTAIRTGRDPVTGNRTNYPFMEIFGALAQLADEITFQNKYGHLPKRAQDSIRKHRAIY